MRVESQGTLASRLGTSTNKVLCKVVMVVVSNVCRVYRGLGDTSPWVIPQVECSVAEGEWDIAHFNQDITSTTREPTTNA